MIKVPAKSRPSVTGESKQQRRVQCDDSESNECYALSKVEERRYILTVAKLRSSSGQQDTHRYLRTKNNRSSCATISRPQMNPPDRYSIHGESKSPHEWHQESKGRRRGHPAPANDYAAVFRFFFGSSSSSSPVARASAPFSSRAFRALLFG